MSMHSTSSIDTTTVPRCNHEAELLGESVRCRRIELGLSIDQAAELSGLCVFQWAALEHALWVPDDGPALRAVTDTLQANYEMVSYCAAVSRANRKPL